MVQHILTIENFNDQKLKHFLAVSEQTRKKTEINWQRTSNFFSCSRNTIAPWLRNYDYCARRIQRCLSTTSDWKSRYILSFSFSVSFLRIATTVLYRCARVCVCAPVYELALARLPCTSIVYLSVALASSEYLSWHTPCVAIRSLQFASVWVYMNTECLIVFGFCWNVFSFLTLLVSVCFAIRIVFGFSFVPILQRLLLTCWCSIRMISSIFSVLFTHTFGSFVRLNKGIMWKIHGKHTRTENEKKRRTKTFNISSSLFFSSSFMLFPGSEYQLQKRTLAFRTIQNHNLCIRFGMCAFVMWLYIDVCVCISVVIFKRAQPDAHEAQVQKHVASTIMLKKGQPKKKNKKKLKLNNEQEWRE